MKKKSTLEQSPLQLYRQLHKGNDGDALFYARALQSADGILEIGAGWGRLSLELAPLTPLYCGVEIEPSFALEAEQALQLSKVTLGHAKQVDWNVIIADARSMELAPARFSHAILPYNVAYALGGLRGFKDVITRVFASLKVGGELFLDVYPIDAYHQAMCEGESEPEDDGAKIGDFTLNGIKYPVFEESHLNVNAQRLDVHYKACEGTQTFVEQQIFHDYLLLEQLIECIEAAGGEITLLAGNFEGAPYDEDSTQIVLGAIKVNPSS